MSTKSARKTEVTVTEVANEQTEGPKLTAAQQKHLAQLKGPSDRIRYLHAEGFDNSEITKLTTNAKGGKLLYQHVYNVLKGPTPSKASKVAKAAK